MPMYRANLAVYVVSFIEFFDRVAAKKEATETRVPNGKVEVII
jgi:hypothetical protein